MLYVAILKVLIDAALTGNSMLKRQYPLALMFLGYLLADAAAVWLIVKAR